MVQSSVKESPKATMLEKALACKHKADRAKSTAAVRHILAVIHCITSQFNLTKQWAAYEGKQFTIFRCTQSWQTTHQRQDAQASFCASPSLITMTSVSVRHPFLVGDDAITSPDNAMS